MKKNIYILIVSLVTAITAQAQPGCTDSSAINYNSTAITNDGSCKYINTSANFESVFPISNLVQESSGIVWTDGELWTHNDSHNTADIYQLEPDDGGVLKTVTISNYYNIDWEDIAADNNYIYIGDFGNNDGNRTDLKIILVDKSKIKNQKAITLSAEAINFSYPDQTDFTVNSETNFDCEALISYKDSLFLFTKDHKDYKTRLYKLPKTPGTYVAEKIDSFNVNGKITGADVSPDGKTIVLIGYESGHTSSFIYMLDDFKGSNFFSGNKRRIEIGSTTKDWQTEGISYYDSNTIWISNEVSNDYIQGAYKATVLDFGILNELLKYEELSNKPLIEAFPNPSYSGIVNFNLNTNNIEKIEVLNDKGEALDFKIIAQGAGKITLNLAGKLGLFEIIVRYNSGKSILSKILLLN